MSNTHRFASRAIFAPSLVYRHLAFALGCAALLLLADKPANAATIQVNMANFKFVPQDIVINAGDTVTWVNQDFTFLDTTSGTNGVRSGLWSSGTFGHGGSFSFTFNVPAGRYAYYCTPHVFTFGMIGSVTVLVPNQPPTVAITAPANGTYVTGTANLTVSATQVPATPSHGSLEPQAARSPRLRSGARRTARMKQTLIQEVAVAALRLTFRAGEP